MTQKEFRKMLLDLLKSDKEVQQAVYDAVRQIKDDMSWAEA